MVTKRTVLVAAALVSSILVGCGSDDDAADGTDEVVDGEATDATETPDADGADDDGADDDGADDDGADDDGAASQLGEVAIDQTETHPSGVEVTVQALRVERNAIFVDLEAFNGASREILLAGLDLAFVVDDTGKEYRYEPPEDNPPLRIASGSTLEGSIAFLGRVGADATSVTLQFNYSRQGEALQPADAENADFADAPSFEFADMPLPNS